MGGHMGPPLRRKCTGSIGSAKPGAKVELHQPQFLQTQGPVARREFRPATQILRAGNFLSDPRGTPRNGVRGRLPLSGGDGPKGQRG